MIPRLNKYHSHPRKQLEAIAQSAEDVVIPKFSHKIEYAPSIYIIHDSDLIQRYLDKCVSWCYNNLGFREDMSSTPSIDWKYQDLDMRKTRTFGYYHPDENMIELRIYGHRTWVNLSNTIIHEWVHYLQPPSWYTRYYNSYSYTSHPYEIMACFYSAVNCNQCATFAWKKISNG